jgi:hypothetical protein
VKGIRELAVVVASTGMITALLGVYFNWRARLPGRIRGEEYAVDRIANNARQSVTKE